MKNTYNWCYFVPESAENENHLHNLHINLSKFIISSIQCQSQVDRNVVPYNDSSSSRTHTPSDIPIDRPTVGQFTKGWVKK